MKKIRLVSIILFACLMYAPLSVFANNKLKTRPGPVMECVSCGFNGTCRSCKGGGGGLFCETFNCGACEITLGCALTDSVGPMPSSRKQSFSGKPLKLSAKDIRDISTKHVRFAATLAEMNVYGFIPSERQVYWTPVKLSLSDIEAFLNKKAHSRFFRQYDTEVRKLNARIQRGELSDIVYDVSIKQTEEGSWSIKMQVENMIAAASVDPAYSTLEINVVVTEPAQTTLGQRSSKTKKKVTWEIQ